jgi:ketosteroid isomerase-like protein
MDQAGGMSVATISAGRQFYDDHIRFCETGNIEGIRSHYTDDAALISFDDQIHGGDAIAEYFRGYLARMAGLTVRSTDRFVETDDTVFFEATIDLDAGVARVYDAFVLRDGRATHHFTGLLGFTPKP